MAFNKPKGRRNDVIVNVDPNADSKGSFGSSRFSPPPADDAPGGRVLDASKKGLSHAWSNYKRVLSDSFKAMSRFQQEALINRLCQIVTIGVTFLALLLFYHMMPLAIRVLAVPLAVVASWWAANNIVTPVVVSRMEPLLKRKDMQDN